MSVALKDTGKLAVQNILMADRVYDWPMNQQTLFKNKSKRNKYDTR